VCFYRFSCCWSRKSIIIKLAETVIINIATKTRETSTSSVFPKFRRAAYAGLYVASEGGATASRALVAANALLGIKQKSILASIMSQLRIDGDFLIIIEPPFLELSSLLLVNVCIANFMHINCYNTIVTHVEYYENFLLSILKCSLTTKRFVIDGYGCKRSLSWCVFAHIMSIQENLALVMIKEYIYEDGYTYF